MRLKRISKNEVRDPHVCNVSRCKSAADGGSTEPGVEFAKKEGKVWLCKQHMDKLHEERMAAADAAKEAAQVADTDAGAMVIVLEHAMRAEMAGEAQEAEKALELIRAMPVDGQDDLDFADELRRDANGRLKWLKDRRTQATKKARETLEEIRSWFKAPIDFYEQAKGLLDDKIRDGMRQLEERQTLQLAAAGEAHQAGDLQTVRQAVDAANELQAVLPESTSLVEHWEFLIEQPDLVPREWCSPDVGKIRAWVDAWKESAVGNLPGVRIFRQDRVRQGGKK